MTWTQKRNLNTRINRHSINDCKLAFDWSVKMLIQSDCPNMLRQICKDRNFISVHFMEQKSFTLVEHRAGNKVGLDPSTIELSIIS